MALPSLSSLSINPLITISSSSKASSRNQPCHINNPETKAPIRDCSNNKYEVRDAKFKIWTPLVSTALAATMVVFGPDTSAFAELNKFEAETPGEFGIGSAAQFGSADLKKAVHVNESKWLKQKGKLHIC